MSYKLYDKSGKEVTHHNLQDKGIWCRDGAAKEEVFVEMYGSKLNLIINPEKEKNPYAPDLFDTTNKIRADLKTINSPFFQAKLRFNINPQYAVVFNGKDRTRYREYYPEIDIYFIIDWIPIKFEGYVTIELQPMVGVWKIPFKDLDKLCNNSAYHEYNQRKFDIKGNAKGSYVLNIQNSKFRKVI